MQRAGGVMATVATIVPIHSATVIFPIDVMRRKSTMLTTPTAAESEKQPARRQAGPDVAGIVGNLM